jgi:hypothetical protein
MLVATMEYIVNRHSWKQIRRGEQEKAKVRGFRRTLPRRRGSKGHGNGDQKGTETGIKRTRKRIDPDSIVETGVKWNKER